MLRFSIASASGWPKRGNRLRMNMLKFSLSRRWASVAIVSKTIDDLPDPDTPVNIVILRLGMRNETFLRLFSRAPWISMYSWATSLSFAAAVTGITTHRRTSVLFYHLFVGALYTFRMVLEYDFP